MANLTAKLSLNTSNNSAEVFSFQLTKMLNVKNPSVQTFAATVAHDADTAVLDGTENTEATYLWIYNTDNTNYVGVELATTLLLRVGPGEAQLLCIEPSKAVDLRANTATCKVEYGYFTLDRY
jgi:hypothetical protein